MDVMLPWCNNGHCTLCVDMLLVNNCIRVESHVVLGICFMKMEAKYECLNVRVPSFRDLIF